MTFVQIEEGGRVLTVDIMKCITSTERKASSFSLYREEGFHNYILTLGGFLQAVNFGFVGRGMHFWNGGHLRSAPSSRQGTKKRRENREKEYVSGTSSSLHTTGRGKKRSLVVTIFWDYRVETLSRALLAPLKHNQCN